MNYQAPEIVPDRLELLVGLGGYVLLAVVVLAVVGLLVGFVARRAVAEPARQRQLIRTAVGVVLVVFVLAALTPLTGAASASRVLAVLPAVVAATLILVLGLFVAPLARGLTHRGLAQLRPGVADLVAPLVYWLVIGLTVLLAADQLGLETRLVQQLVALVVGGLVLAAGLALGLGSRDLVGAVVAGRHVAQIVAVGDRVEVAGQAGTVVALGHASVRLALDGGGEVEVPNSLLLSQPVLVHRR